MIIYELQDDHVAILFAGGKQKKIFYTGNSGKVYYRNAYNSKLEVIKHEGVYIGIDKLGIHYFLHNDKTTGIAKLVTRGEFAKGHRVMRDKLPSEVSTFVNLKRALTKAFKEEPLIFHANEKQAEVKKTSPFVGIGLSLLVIFAAAVADKKEKN